MVVRAQRGGLLPDHAAAGPDVLLHGQGGRAPRLLVPPVGGPLLVPDLPVHLGRTPPPAVHGPARLGPDPGHDLLGHAVGPQLGRHAQRSADPARRLGQAAHRPRHQVLRRGGDLLRHEHLRRPPAEHQERQRPGPLHGLDHRSRARRRPGLERLHDLRYPLLDVAAAVRHQAVEHPPGRGPLLGRHHRHPDVRGLHVGQRRQPGPVLARPGRRRLPQVPRLHRRPDQQPGHVPDPSLRWRPVRREFPVLRREHDHDRQAGQPQDRQRAGARPAPRR